MILAESEAEETENARKGGKLQESVWETMRRAEIRTWSDHTAKEKGSASHLMRRRKIIVGLVCGEQESWRSSDLSSQDCM